MVQSPSRVMLPRLLRAVPRRLHTAQTPEQSHGPSTRPLTMRFLIVERCSLSPDRDKLYPSKISESQNDDLMISIIAASSSQLGHCVMISSAHLSHRSAPPCLPTAWPNFWRRLHIKRGRHPLRSHALCLGPATGCGHRRSLWCARAFQSLQPLIAVLSSLHISRCWPSTRDLSCFNFISDDDDATRAGRNVIGGCCLKVLTVNSRLHSEGSALGGARFVWKAFYSLKEARSKSSAASLS